MDRLAVYQLGIYHHNKDKGNSDLSDNTCDNQINIMSERLPEGAVRKKLCVILDSDEGLLRSALPLEKAVNKCRNQRHKYRKYEHCYRNHQIQNNRSCLWFDCI